MSPPELNVLHQLYTNTGIPAKLIQVKPWIDQKMGEDPYEKMKLPYKFPITAEIRPYENPRALQGRTVFNRYLGNG